MLLNRKAEVTRGLYDLAAVAQGVNPAEANNPARAEPTKGGLFGRLRLGKAATAAAAS